MGQHFTLATACMSAKAAVRFMQRYFHKIFLRQLALALADRRTVKLNHHLSDKTCQKKSTKVISLEKGRIYSIEFALDEAQCI